MSMSNNLPTAPLQAVHQYKMYYMSVCNCAEEVIIAEVFWLPEKEALALNRHWFRKLTNVPR